jgi:hypothetical protein
MEVLRISWLAPAGTSLTGASHRSDRCKTMVLEVLVPLRSRVHVGGCWFLGPVALQWLCGLGQRG